MEKSLLSKTTLIMILLLCLSSFHGLRARQILTIGTDTASSVADITVLNGTTDRTDNTDAGKLNGTYTIGGDHPDFRTFREAFEAMVTYGISGPVTLKIHAGTYGGISITGTVPGSSDTNRITVMPDSAAEVTFDGGATDAGIHIYNTANWTFKGVNFGNTANGKYGVLVEGGNRNMLFQDCGIYAAINNAKDNYGVFCNNTSVENVRFIHNTFKGGVANLRFDGTGNSSSVTITDNILADAASYGIYSYDHNHFKSISRNTITNRIGTSTYNGIYLYNYTNIDTLDANSIHVTANNGYGIYMGYYINFSHNGTAGTISNNEIIVRNKNSAYGIYLYRPEQSWNVVHNSIYTESASAAANAFLYDNFNTGTAYTITAKNNLFVAKAPTAYPIYTSAGAAYAAAPYASFDYNNYYGEDLNGKATNVGFAGVGKTSLTDWQNTSKNDFNSLNIKPNFVDETNSLELNDFTPFLCPVLPGVPFDLRGTPRNYLTCVGCYSLLLYDDYDLTAKSILKPTEAKELMCIGEYADVEVCIQNTGCILADFSIIPVKISLIVTGSTNYRFDTTLTQGQLSSTQFDTISLGQMPTMASGNFHIQIVVSSTSDKHPEDDTVSMIYNANHITLPYDVDFTTVPDEFINISRSGKSNWEVCTAKATAITPDFGTGYMKFNGVGNAGSIADAVFNSVSIYQTANPKLSLWYAHTGDAVRDFLSILVTTDEGTTYTELGKIATSDTGVYWKQYDFDLSKYVNENCISILFKAYSMGKTDQYIDRIRITADKDMAIHMIVPETDSLSACHLQNQPVKVVVENLTRSIIPIVNDTIRVNVTGASTQQYTYVYSKQLQGFEKDTLILSNGLDLSANGHYYFEAFMQAIDDKPENDTLRDSTLYIMQDMAMDTVYGIDAQMFKIAGDTVYVTAVAVNNGNIPVDEVLLHLNIDGNEVICDTIRQHLNAGDTLAHAMSVPYIVPGVSKDQPYYFFEVSTDISCDGVNDNNSIQLVGQVNIPDSIDIQVLDITATTPAKGKTKVSPTVRIANIGNLDAYSVMLHVDVIDSTNSVVGSISETVNYLAINETKDVTFTMNYTVPNYTGTYTLKAYVEQYSGDAFRSNDTLRKAFANEVDDTRIRESESLNWSMGQNIPNPAGNITRIPFSLPQDAEVVFSVMGASGQLIYREVLSASAGSNTVDFNVDNLANGVYYYSMECNGQRFVKKMNVAR